MSKLSGGVSGSCGSNLVRESAYGPSVGTCCHPRLAECEPGQLNCGGQIPTGWRALGLMSMATIPLGFADSVPACVLLSSVLSAVTDGCWGFNSQTFLANNTVRVKCSLPRGSHWGPCEDHLVMNLQKY